MDMVCGSLRPIMDCFFNALTHSVFTTHVFIIHTYRHEKGEEGNFLHTAAET